MVVLDERPPASKNPVRREALKLRVYKLCTIAMLGLSRVLEMINDFYMSHVVSKAAFLHIEDVGLPEEDTFPETIKQFAVFSHSKVSSV